MAPSPPPMGVCHLDSTTTSPRMNFWAAHGPRAREAEEEAEEEDDEEAWSLVSAAPAPAPRALALLLEKACSAGVIGWSLVKW